MYITTLRSTFTSVKKILVNAMALKVRSNNKSIESKSIGILFKDPLSKSPILNDIYSYSIYSHIFNTKCFIINTINK